MKQSASIELKLHNKNRTILECKFLFMFFNNPHILIKIEPYWNVNTVDVFSIAIIATIKIEPYWNVNYLMYEHDGIKYYDKNRTILECKYDGTRHICFCLLIKIEPYWNVNTEEMKDPDADTPIKIEPYWNVNLNKFQNLASLS